MDKEGSSPACGLRGRWPRDRWLCDQVVGTRSLAQRSGRGCQVAGSVIRSRVPGRGLSNQQPT
ncbi:UNVERIFIED_CONTAM: hypothetical protein Slati_0213200 [Sesamum latifolium]|uniref:Uncharacterized protein n=1 Tax=Sesamum latifolium TaxID=2727402 RepID=A0AAW2YBK0_9LAMI